MNQIDTINKATEHVSGLLQGRKPVAGIVLGSGLGKLADLIEDPIVIPYTDIPGFPPSTAIGHKGNFIVGNLAGKCVIAMQGRIHYYEGYGIDKVVLPIRVMIKLGIKNLFVSNAAGGTNFDFRIGDLMIITDQINLIPSPLVGPNIDEFGPRFPDMTRPYDPSLIRLGVEVAAKLDIPVRKGVYLAVTGPAYESPAEYRFFRMAGADAVGMSTAPEVIVARHAGIPVFGMSVITDVATATDAEEYITDGHEIVAIADKAAEKMSKIFLEVLRQI